MSTFNRQRGQITTFLAMAAIPIALGLAYLFNSAELLSRKVRVQDAVDAAAIAQGTWMARSMNVMATNNVALTQTSVINNLAAAINLTVVDLTQFLTRRAIQEGITAAAMCPLGGFLNPKCDAALVQLGLIAAAAKQLEDLVALNLLAHAEFFEHAHAYADANRDIARRFPEFSAQMQRDLAASNGLAAPPRMQAVGWRKGPGMFVSMDRTGLPVARVDVPSLGGSESADDAFTLVWAAVRSINSTGEDGFQDTPTPVLRPMARNFKDHGYPDEEGPYEKAREAISDDLETAIDLANVLGWSESIGEDPPEYDDCWDAASMIPVLPMTCRNGVPVPIPPLEVPLYGPSQAAALDGAVAAWGITYVLVLARSDKATGHTAGGRFPNATAATYGLAKVRVFNATSPDLYSSDWRAVLVPVSSWRGNSAMPPQLRVALRNVTRTDPTLTGIVGRLNDQELLRALSR